MLIVIARKHFAAMSGAVWLGILQKCYADQSNSVVEFSAIDQIIGLNRAGNTAMA